MNDIRVQLTNEQIMAAAYAGVERQAKNIIKGNKSAHRSDSPCQDWQIHVEGCLTELALSLYLGLPWKGKGVLGEPDVGDEHESRNTRYHTGKLSLYKKDHIERRFWLLVGANGRYEVRGWIWGRDGKQDKYWGSLPGKTYKTWYVPQSDLHPPGER